MQLQLYFIKQESRKVLKLQLLFAFHFSNFFLYIDFCFLMKFFLYIDDWSEMI